MDLSRENGGLRAQAWNLVGHWITSILDGLTAYDDAVQGHLMELCGETCAKLAEDYEWAKRIAQETPDLSERLTRLNQEIAWCGTWTHSGNTIQTECLTCGCPLVRSGLIEPTATFCLCSRGWVKTIFSTLLQGPVQVELVKSLGAGDTLCKFIVRPETD